MSNIKNIIIVGGGSAGWMAATYLNKKLMPEISGIDIKLIESPDIETIGVGEATVPTIRDFFAAIEVPEKELLVRTNGTIKSAIRFVDWYEKGDGGYYHPFEAPLFGDGIDIASHWVSEKLKGRPVDKFAHAVGLLPTLSEAQRVSKTPDTKDYEAPLLYAYHLDAVLMAGYLREVALKRGVTRVEDTVTDIRLNDKGEIAALKCEKTGEHQADFFIDCTGFAAILIEKTLNEKFVSFADELLCNRAVAMQTEYTKQDGFPPPYTTATAKTSGWIWEIGLAGRKGNGYVYSDRFISPDEAEQEFRSHLGKQAEGKTARHLRMRVGRRENFWAKNCLAIGLSGGFVEPLESTGLQFIEVGLRLFVEYFPSKENYEPLRRRYNQSMVGKFADVKDFIVMHYCLTQREDTEFWRHAKHDLKISDSLKEQLEIWRQKIPTHDDLKEVGLFGAPNYTYILAGMHYLAHDSINLLANIPSERSQKILGQMKTFQQRAVKLYPPHQVLIDTLHRMVKK